MRSVTLALLLSLVLWLAIAAMIVTAIGHAHAPVPQPWLALADCESGDGDGRAPFRADWDYNGRSGFDGGFQFHPSTWRDHRRAGEPRFAFLASPLVQLRVARRVLASQGWRAWPDCSRKLGLR